MIGSIESNQSRDAAFDPSLRRMRPGGPSVVGLTLAAGLLSAPAPGVGQTLTTTTGTTTLTGVKVYGAINNGSAATIVNNGATTGELSNAGVYTNNGSQTGDIARNSGAINNSLGAVWNGNVRAGANLGGGAIVNRGQWNGAIANTGGSVDNRNTVAGDIANASGTFRNSLAASVVAGRVANDGATINAGAIKGGLTNNAGTTTNSGAIEGGAVVGGGTLTTTGAVAGGLTNGAAGTVNASGSIAGAVANAGAFTVTGALVGSRGAINNTGTATLRLRSGDYTQIGVLTNSSTAEIGVRVDAGRTLAAQKIENAAGATLANLGTVATDAGFVNTGIYRQNDVKAKLTGGLDNATGGIVVASGSMAGGVVNAGVFNVVNDVDNSGDDFENVGAGAMRVVATAEYKGNYRGIGALTNKSTAAAGVRVDVGRTLAAQKIFNAAGSTLVNSGTIETPGEVVNAGFYNQNDATAKLTGRLVNAAGGTVTAAGSLVGVVNAGRFTLTGALGGDGVSAFENRTGGVLDVAQNFTGFGRLVNDGTVAIGPGARLALGGDYVNAATGTTTNAGTLAAPGGVVNLSARFANAGRIEGAVTNGDGAAAARFDNIGGEKGAGARILGTVTNRGFATFDNTGVVEGDFINDPGAVLNAANTITGRIDNAGVINLTGALDPTIVDNANRLNLGDHTLVAALVNNRASAVVTATNGRIVGDLVNAGVVDLTGGPRPAENTLSVTGHYAGGGVLRVAADLRSGAAAHSGALLLGGSGSGNTAIHVSHGLLGYFRAPVQVVRDGGGSTYTLARPIGGGLLNVSLQQLAPGQWYLTSRLDTGPLSAVASAVGSAMTSASTGFFRNPASFVARVPNARPNHFSLSLWTNATAGRNDVFSVASVAIGGGVDRTAQKTRALYEGYQLGADLALSNIENTRVDAHLGVTAGQYFSHAYELLGSATTSAFNTPFVGVYGVLAGRNFYIDALARHDFWNMRLTNAAARLDNTRIGGDGWGGSVSAGYRHELGDGWFVEPSAAMHVASASFGDVPVSAGDLPATLRLGAIRSALGRAGLRMGATFLASAFVLRPFASADFWREFQGDMQASFGQSDTIAEISVSRIGTFAQLGLGVSALLVDTGWAGFLSGDYRVGEQLNGGGVKGGLRYIF